MGGICKENNRQYSPLQPAGLAQAEAIKYIIYYFIVKSGLPFDVCTLATPHTNYLKIKEEER